MWGIDNLFLGVIVVIDIGRLLKSGVFIKKSRKFNKNKMDLKALNSALERVAEEKGISANEVLNAVETAIAAAYKK